MAFEDINSLPQNNPNINSLIDQSFISQTTPSGYEQSLIDAYNTSLQPEQIGAQGQASLYPGLSLPETMGSVSTQTFGSGNTYAPGGGLLALDPMLARRKALDDAARKRAAEIKPWERPKAPEFTDPYWNKQLYNVVNTGLDKVWQDAVNNYGIANARVVLQDPNTSYGQRVAKLMNNAEYLTKNVNQITDLVVAIDKGLQDKTIYLNPEKKKLYESYKQKLANFEDIDTLQQSNLPELTRQLMGVRDLNDYLNTSKVMDKLEAQIKSSFGVSEQDDYFRILETETKTWKPIIKDLSRELSETTFAGEYSQKDIEEALDARLKDQISKKGSISQKTEATRGSEGEGNIPNADMDGIFITHTTPNKTLHNFDVIATYNMSYMGKPKDLVVITNDGVKTTKVSGVDMSNIQYLNEKGERRKIEGNSRVQLGKAETLGSGRVVQNAIVYTPKDVYVKNGQIVPEGTKGSVRQQTWESSNRLLVLYDKNDKGSTQMSQIKSQIQKEMGKEAADNYEKGVVKLRAVNPSSENNSTKTKPSGGNNVQEGKPKQVVQNGITYTLNEQTGEYE